MEIENNIEFLSLFIIVNSMLPSDITTKTNISALLKTQGCVEKITTKTCVFESLKLIPQWLCCKIKRLFRISTMFVRYSK